MPSPEAPGSVTEFPLEHEVEERNPEGACSTGKPAPSGEGEGRKRHGQHAQPAQQPLTKPIIDALRGVPEEQRPAALAAVLERMWERNRADVILILRRACLLAAGEDIEAISLQEATRRYSACALGKE